MKRSTKVHSSADLLPTLEFAAPPAPLPKKPRKRARATVRRKPAKRLTRRGR
jgi:hypothetical protein